MRALVGTALLSCLATVIDASTLPSVPLHLDAQCASFQCVARLANERCYESAHAPDPCLEFLAAVERSAHANEWEYRRIQAETLTALSLRSHDSKELQSRRRELFAGLARERPDDAGALLGLASVALNGVERAALLERAAAADPTGTFALGALARIADDGTDAGMDRALAYARQAYERARPPHRWHLATNVYFKLEARGPQNEAGFFATSVRNDMGIPRARRQLTAQLRRPDSLEAPAALALLRTICNSRALILEGGAACVEDIEAVSVALAGDASAAPDPGHIDEFAGVVDETMRSYRVLTAPGNRGRFIGSLARLREAGRHTAFLLAVEGRARDPDYAVIEVN